MKHRYLFLAFLVMISFYLPIKTYLFFSICFFIYMKYKSNKIPLIFIILYFMMITTLHLPTIQTIPKSIVKIDQIKNNYMIANDGYQKVILYQLLIWPLQHHQLWVVLK